MKKFLTIIFMIFVFTSKVFASTADNESSNSIPYDGNRCDDEYGNQVVRYCCRIPNVSISVNNSLTVDIFSLKDQSKLLNTSSFTVLDNNDYFTAGTAVILDIHDDYYGSWNLEGNYYIQTNDAASEYNEMSDDECKNMVISFIRGQIENSMLESGIHTVEYSKDDSKEKFTVSPTTTVDGDIEIDKDNIYETKTFSSRTSYNIYKTCLNRKTGKVNYLSDGEVCDSDSIDVNEMYGIYDKTIYFIPFNLKSTDNFGVKVGYNAAAGIGGQNAWTFNGRRNWNIKLPFKQKFYNEVGNGRNSYLDGFNFYARQIDYNSFTTNINNCSFWKADKSNDYIDSAINSIGSSFDSISYLVDKLSVDNIKKIREYNKNHKYTDWDNVNIDGSSSYIDNSLIVRTNNDSHYKLGCGPLNSDKDACK